MSSILRTHNSNNYSNSTRNDSNRTALAQTHFGNTAPTRNNNRSLVSRTNNNRHVSHGRLRENAMDKRNNSSSALRKRRRMSRSQGVILDAPMSRRPICPRDGNQRHSLQHYSNRPQHMSRVSSLFWWRHYLFSRSSFSHPLASFLTSFTASVSAPYYALAALVASSHDDQAQRSSYMIQDRSRHFPTRTTGAAELISPTHCVCRQNTSRHQWCEHSAHTSSLAISDSCRNRQRAWSMSSSAVQLPRPGRPMHRCLSDQSTPMYSPASRQPASCSPSHSYADITTTVRVSQNLDSDHPDDYADSIHLSWPFQLLLVSRRFSDAAVQSLWKGLVFHGHDSLQIQTLLATLSQEDGVFESTFEPSKHQFSVLQRLKEELSEDENETSDEVSSISLHGHVQEEYRTISLVPTTGLWLESLNRSMTRFRGRLLGIKEVVESDPVETADHGMPTSPSEQQGSTAQSWTSAESKTGTRNNYYRRHSASSLELSLEIPVCHSSAPTSSPVANLPRWSYRRFVKRVILNFAHPQAKPRLLVQVLETLGSRCKNQIQELDLHANEKMRAQGSGLETSADLERLFGSGFQKLKCLRLQGGFFDNQLLSAIIKGLTPPILTASSPVSSVYTQGRPPIAVRDPPSTLLKSSSIATKAPPCRLSQVFLGPGSITDSAIEKLIAVAGQSLEVFTVTSCVDVGGGALASLLTKCPNLRVLGVYRSLARDTELLEGLGVTLTSEGHVLDDVQNDSSDNVHVATQAANSGSTQQQRNTHEPSLKARNKIIAPLERLELGTVKLTTVSVAEILRGTFPTLRFLVLETRHFKEEFLRDVIVPLCQKLEGLYFDDLEYVQRAQQRATPGAPTANINPGDAANINESIHMMSAQQQQQQRGPVVPNRFFQFGRSRRNFFAEPVQRSSHRRSQGGADRIHVPNVSPWLGETSTHEWITLGDCALWASTPASAAIYSDNNGNGAGNGRVGTTLNRSMAMNIGNILPHPPGSYNTPAGQPYGHGVSATRAEDDSSEAHGRGEGGFYSMAPFDGDYRTVLEGFSVDLSTIEMVTQSLHGLQKFEVMQMVLVTDAARSARESGDMVGKSSEEQREQSALRQAFGVLVGLAMILFFSTVVLDCSR